MGWFLDRTPVVVLLFTGCLIGGVLALLALVAPTLFDLAIKGLGAVGALGVVTALGVGLLRGLYESAFEQPRRTKTGRHPVMHLLLGTAYVLGATFALDLIGNLHALLTPTPNQPSPPGLLYTWLLREWLVATAEVAALLVLMRLLAAPWRRWRAWIIPRIAAWRSTFGGSRSHELPPDAPGA